MGPLMTEDQIRRSHAEFEEDMKRVNKNNRNVILAFIIISALLLILFIVKTALHKINPAVPKITMILTLILTTVLWIILLIGVRRIEKLTKKHLHAVIKGKSQKALTFFYNHPFTPQASSELAAAISAEGDLPTRYTLNDLLFNNKLTMGDTNGAYACLVNDSVLFSRDRYFEMKYYSDLMNYYFYLGDSPQCREYAEQAYIGFVNIFSSYGSNSGYSVTETVMDVMRLDAFFRGEWQRCYDICRLKTELNNSSSAAGGELIRTDNAITKLLQAECLYNMGEYRSALIVCDEAGHSLAGTEYQLRRANALAGKIHAALGDSK